MDFLKSLNHAVVHLEKDFAVSNTPPLCIFVIGVPRSGTTLVSQIMSGCMDVGYVNNLMARFWEAPTVGARLSTEVLERRIFTGASNFGQTRYAEEPHEFGGFWRKILNYENMTQKESDEGISWRELATTLNRIATVFGKPVVYKVFQLYWHLEKFHSYLPSSKWIWVRRNPVENAMSLIHMREEKTRSCEKWFSARPLGADKYDHEPAWCQVAAQVKLIEDWIGGQLAKIPAENSFEIYLEDICMDPIGITKNIAQQLAVPIFEKNLNDIENKIKPEVFEEKDNALKNRIEKSFQMIREGNI